MPCSIGIDLTTFSYARSKRTGNNTLSCLIPVLTSKLCGFPWPNIYSHCACVLQAFMRSIIFLGILNSTRAAHCLSRTMAYEVNKTHFDVLSEFIKFYQYLSECENMIRVGPVVKQVVLTVGCVFL